MMSGSKINVIKKGDPLLNKVAEPIQPEEFNTAALNNIIDELNTIAKELKAVGFAAPQIGYSKRVMMIGMEFKNPRRPNVEPFANQTFVNPEVIYTSDKTTADLEGCASIDDTVVRVSRPVTIKYKAQDRTGNTIEGELNGFRARVFLHEMDHLNGKLITDEDRALETTQQIANLDPIISMKP